MRGSRRNLRELLRGPSRSITVEPVDLPPVERKPAPPEVKPEPEDPSLSVGMIRIAVEQVMQSDGDFVTVGSIAKPQLYVQWIEHDDGAIWVEVADPSYNGYPALTPAQMAAVEELGLEKASVNFGRDFAPGDIDGDALTGFILECVETVFGIDDAAGLEFGVDC